MLWSMLGEGGWLLGDGIDAADDCAGDAYYGGNAGILGDSRCAGGLGGSSGSDGASDDS